jgi:hypothetical protein
MKNETPRTLRQMLKLCGRGLVSSDARCAR